MDISRDMASNLILLPPALVIGKFMRAKRGQKGAHTGKRVKQNFISIYWIESFARVCTQSSSGPNCDSIFILFFFTFDKDDDKCRRFYTRERHVCCSVPAPPPSIYNQRQSYIQQDMKQPRSFNPFCHITQIKVW